MRTHVSNQCLGYRKSSNLPLEYLQYRSEEVVVKDVGEGAMSEVVAKSSHRYIKDIILCNLNIYISFLMILLDLVHHLPSNVTGA